MFERFSDRARRVVVLAQGESERLFHGYIGTEHILLGLIRESELNQGDDGVGITALKAMGADLSALRSQIEAIVEQGSYVGSGHIPFSSEAKSVLELGLKEALLMNHNYIGSEHLFLALVREERGLAANVLSEAGVELIAARKKVVLLLGGYSEELAPSNMTIELHSEFLDFLLILAQRKGKSVRVQDIENLRALVAKLVKQ